MRRSIGVHPERMRSQSEYRRYGFRLVANDVCERSHRAVGQLGPELIGGSGRIHMQEHLEFVAVRHRRVVLDRDPKRGLEQLRVRSEELLDDLPVDRVVDMVEQVDIADPDRELPNLVGVRP